MMYVKRYRLGEVEKTQLIWFGNVRNLEDRRILNTIVCWAPVRPR